MKREVTQKAISAKVELHILGAVDTLCFETGMKRNAVLNDALKMYLQFHRAMHDDFQRGGNMSTKQIERYWRHVFGLIR